MLRKSLEDGYLFLAAGGIGIIAVLVRILLSVSYGWLAHAANTMDRGNSKSLEKLTWRFKQIYRENTGMNNVDVFVDKYLNSRKACGLYLSTWESISGQARLLCLVIAVGTGIISRYYECGQIVTLSTIAISLGIIAMIYFVDIFSALPAKKIRLKVNIFNYLENNMRVHLESDIMSNDTKVPEFIKKDAVQAEQLNSEEEEVFNPNDVIQITYSQGVDVEDEMISNDIADSQLMNNDTEVLRLREMDAAFAETAACAESVLTEQDILFEEEFSFEEDMMPKRINKKLVKAEMRLKEKKRKENERALKNKIKAEEKEVFARIREEEARIKLDKKKSLTMAREQAEQEALAEMRKRREEKQLERKQRTLEELRQASMNDTVKEVKATVEEIKPGEKMHSREMSNCIKMPQLISNDTKVSKLMENKIIEDVLKEFLT